MTGGVTDVDEDPDAPDTLWVNATSASVNPSARFTFPTPTGPVTATQTFRARVRKHGGSATPTARIDLYENGVLRATGTNQNVTSTTGQTITQTFDAASLVDRSGAGVEARFVGTATGSGAKIASVDLGAIRWTETYVVSPQTLNDFSYTYDEVGNPTIIGTPTESAEYRYDERDRLVRVCAPRINCIQTPEPPPSAPDVPGGPYISIDWTYDGVGNRLSQTRNDTLTTTYSYDADDRLTQRTTNGVATAYSYDTNGNELSADTAVFAYDQANRLVSAQAGNTNETYAYDGDGNRVRTSATSQTVNSLWDINQALPQLALERDTTGATLRRYTYGAARISMDTPVGAFYYHADRLGSVSKSEMLNVTSGSILVGLAGLELYTPYPRPNLPKIRPLPLTRPAPRFRIDWVRGVEGGALATAAVGAGLLLLEVDAGAYIVYRLALVF